jgi:hypothetical protein
MMVTKYQYLSPSKKAWITRKIKSGKTKHEIAEEMNLPHQIVYYWTRAYPSKNCGWPGIRGQTLDVLQEIITKGYAISSGLPRPQYRTLRKYFPSICKITIHNRSIYVLEGKQEIAVKAFLGMTNKKIISYQDLKQVTDVFNVSLSKKDKEAFLSRNHPGEKG